MRHLLFVPALLLMLNVCPGMVTGQTAATTTLTANPTTITVGSSVGLTATVQPNSAPGAGKTVPRPTGTITFLDGSTSLSSAPIAVAPNGIASATFPQTFGTPDPAFTPSNIDECRRISRRSERRRGSRTFLSTVLQPPFSAADLYQQRERRLQH